MSLNIINLSYLLFRLAPIIIVSFFVFQSFLYWDLKGVIYLCGLLLTTVVALFANNFADINGTNGSEILIPDRNPRCNIITLGGDNGEYLSSNIPLNLVVYAYSFFYLLIFILNSANVSTKGILNNKGNNYENIRGVLQQNIPILVFFPVIIIIETIWILSNNCINNEVSKTLFYCFIAFIIGALCGVLWAIAITSLNIPQLQYIVSKNMDVCSRPRKTLYRCKPRV
jgi:hypothetical protein